MLWTTPIVIQVSKASHQAAAQGNSADMLRLLAQTEPHLHQAFAKAYLPQQLGFAGLLSVIKYLEKHEDGYSGRVRHHCENEHLLYWVAYKRKIR